MTKRKRNQPTVEDILERPWCYYCERDFDDLKILISHQKAKHYKCSLCTRRLNTAGGLGVHMSQVHKEALTVIENALPNRKDVNIEIFGMEGIPQEVLDAHKQRITAEYFKRVADRRLETGNPPAGGNTNTAQKKPKIETAEEIKQRLAEHKAKKEAERLAKLGGDRGSTTPGSTTGPSVPPQPSPMDAQNSPLPVEYQSPFQAQVMPSGTPVMPLNGQYFAPPGPSPMGQGPMFGMPPQMPPHQMHSQMPSHMPPHMPPIYHNGPPPPAFAMPFVDPAQQYGVPNPFNSPFNGQSNSPVPQSFSKPPTHTIKQAALPVDVPGLPARPSTNAPNFSKEDMARLHAGAPARQNTMNPSMPPLTPTSHAPSPIYAGSQQAVAGGHAEDMSSLRESKQDTSVMDNGVTHTSTITTAAGTKQDSDIALPQAPSSLQVANEATPDVKTPDITTTTTSKKSGKKSKGADSKTKLVYSDNIVSPEEKRASFSRYAYKRDESTSYTQGDVMPAVTGTVQT